MTCITILLKHAYLSTIYHLCHDLQKACITIVSTVSLLRNVLFTWTSDISKDINFLAGQLWKGSALNVCSLRQFLDPSSIKTQWAVSCDELSEPFICKWGSIWNKYFLCCEMDPMSSQSSYLEMRKSRMGMMAVCLRACCTCSSHPLSSSCMIRDNSNVTWIS